MLVFLLVFTSCTVATAAPPQVKVVLLDLSLLTEMEEFQQNTAAVGREVIAHLAPGERLYVFAIKQESFQAPWLLFAGEIPDKCGTMQIACLRQKKVLTERWQQRQATLRPEARQSDIFGALALAAKTCQSNGPACTVILYSDMRHDTREREVSLEALSEIPPQLIALVKKRGHLQALDGASVYMLGVHTMGRTPQYYNSLERFWRAYFADAGAQVKAFRLDRRLE
jgi:hypothetical protein